MTKNKYCSTIRQELSTTAQSDLNLLTLSFGSIFRELILVSNESSISRKVLKRGGKVQILRENTAFKVMVRVCKSP